VIPVADHKRQGMELYWNWRTYRSEQQDSTNDVRRIPGRRPRDVSPICGDVTQRYRELRTDVESHNDRDRWLMDRNPPVGRRSRRLDPLIHDSSHHHQPQQQPKLPRQRRRHRHQLTSRTSTEVTKTTPRGFYTSRGIPATSRVALGDVTTFLTSSRDLSRFHNNFPTASSYNSTLTPMTRPRKHNEPALWSKSYVSGHGLGWNTPGLLESPGRMSCIQLQLVDQLRNVSLIQVNPVVKVRVNAGGGHSVPHLQFSASVVPPH